MPITIGRWGTTLIGTKGEDGEEVVVDEAEEAAAATGVALVNGDVDAVNGEDVDEAG